MSTLFVTIPNVALIGGGRIPRPGEVPRTNIKDLESETPGEASAQIRERVKRARESQQQRYAEDGIFCNAQIQPRQLKTHCKIEREAKQLMRDTFERMGLSARAHDRILKVARTIADLAGEATVSSKRPCRTHNKKLHTGGMQLLREPNLNC